MDESTGDGALGADLTRAGYVRTLALAGLLGVPVAFAAVLFETALHDVIRFTWEVVPDWLGWEEPAWWYVIAVPALAGSWSRPRSGFRATAGTRRSRG